MSKVVNIVALLIAVALAVALYKAKDEAGDARARIAALEGELSSEARAIQVLKAEIAYLEDPARLRTLADEKLGLKPVDPVRVVDLAEAPLLLEEERAGPPTATASYATEPRR